MRTATTDTFCSCCSLQIQTRLRQLEASRDDLRFRAEKLKVQLHALPAQTIDIAPSSHSACSVPSSVTAAPATAAATSTLVSGIASTGVNPTAKRPGSAASKEESKTAASSSDAHGDTPAVAKQQSLSRPPSSGGSAQKVIASNGAATGQYPAAELRSTASTNVLALVVATQEDIARCMALVESNRRQLMGLLASWATSNESSVKHLDRVVRQYQF